MAAVTTPTPKFMIAILGLGVLLIAVLPPALIVGGLQEKTRAEPVKSGVTTSGTIVDYEPVTSVAVHATSISYDPVIEFTDGKGHVHLFDAPSVDNKPKKGTKVRVSYDPSNPGHATDLSVSSGRWKGFFFTGLGLTIPEVGLIGWLVVKRFRKKKAA